MKMKKQCRGITVRQLKTILGEYGSNAQVEIYEDNSVWITGTENKKICNLQAEICEIGRRKRWNNG